MLVSTTTSEGKKDLSPAERRLSSQPLLPQILKNEEPKEAYEIFPFHQMGPGKVYAGYPSLAAWIMDHSSVLIDGFSSVYWEQVRSSLSETFNKEGIVVNWIDMSAFLKSPSQIQSLVEPYLGSNETLWGKKFNQQLVDFYDADKLARLRSDESAQLTIVYGPGAALVNWPDAPVIYLDVPKNECQYRMRAGTITNLGMDKSARSSEMYKRFYFVDWVVLNEHKKQLLPKIAVFADAQWIDSINWTPGADFRESLSAITKSVFRVRPWFEAGAWGGQWMKDRFEGLNKDEVNYAWSFELIVPENGVVFESDGHLLELSFDFLMYADNKSVLGKHAELFGDEFPIRFDFLDTWEGGNLSIQCHPSLQYIREQFGETITQDETYYILDCKEDATVYLGFQDNIDPTTFRTVLEESRNNNQIVPIEEYVQAHKAKKHDLFLIPNGTVHSAGANNVVLEISATPYIFTFKMYDWLRLDLNGEPRAINIEHAFNNLKFERKGGRVQDELISKPTLIESGDDWQVIHLPTHAEHLYDVHRVEFDNSVLIHTNESCHVLMLVEGTSVSVETADGAKHTFHYAETFVVPAAANVYRVINKGKERAKLIKAFIKDNVDFLND